MLHYLGFDKTPALYSYCIAIKLKRCMYIWQKKEDAIRNNITMWKHHSLSSTCIYRCRAKNLKCECVGRINVMFNPQNIFWFFMRACGGSLQVIWKHSSTYIHALDLLDLYYIRVQVSSKRLSVYPKFIYSFTGLLPSFFNFPSSMLCCWGERQREVFLLWTRKCCWIHRSPASFRALKWYLSWMPWMWFTFVCPSVLYCLPVPNTC